MKRPYAAAVVVAVFLATACTSGQPVGSDAAGSPSLLSTPATSAPSLATVGPSPTPSPSRSPRPSPSSAGTTAGQLPAGTYVRTPFLENGCPTPPQPWCTDGTIDDSIRINFTVPDGWSESGPEGIGVGPDPGASLLFVRGANLNDDPCRNSGLTNADVPPEIPVGPTVDDFASAVAAHPLLEVTAPVDVTLAGYSGKYLELQVPADISKCAIYRPWDPWYYAQGPGERWHLWVLDVGGVRVVIQGVDFPGTSAQHRTELQAIVDSIRIEP